MGLLRSQGHSPPNHEDDLCILAQLTLQLYQEELSIAGEVYQQLLQIGGADF